MRRHLHQHQHQHQHQHRHTHLSNLSCVSSYARLSSVVKEKPDKELLRAEVEGEGDFLGPTLCFACGSIETFALRENFVRDEIGGECWKRLCEVRILFNHPKYTHMHLSTLWGISINCSDFFVDEMI